MNGDSRVTGHVLGVPIDVVDWESAIKRIFHWGAQRESRYVCICNVHSVITAKNNKELGYAVAHSDMATADGAPVAWFLRKLGFPAQQRINGPDLMWKCCAEAERVGMPIYLYGSTPDTLALLEANLKRNFNNLVIAGSHSPSFGTMSDKEEKLDIERINASGAGLVFVGMGCPKQEIWMAKNRGTVNAVLVGVGAAFNFHAGIIQRAPLWMQNSGLEWLHRLISEPGRLWKRYLVTNTAFIVGTIFQLYIKRQRSAYSGP
jgi:N-acetylglucosaminyldiphosphoundecaprenol N-acetyl-beta-D-mannosaminyltransferase